LIDLSRIKIPFSEMKPFRIYFDFGSSFELGFKFRGSSKRSFGFSLLELLVVVAILGLLSVLTVPGVMEGRIRAKAQAETENLRIIEAAKRSFEAANPGKPLASIGDLVPYLPEGKLPSSVYVETSASGAQIPNSSMQSWTTATLSKIATANYAIYGSSLAQRPQTQSTSYSFEWVNDALIDEGISPFAYHYLDPNSGQGYLNVLSLSHPTMSTFNGDPGKEPQIDAPLTANGYNDLSSAGKIYVIPPRPSP